MAEIGLKWLFWYVFIVFCFVGCQKKEAVVQPAFYHWQTHFLIDSVESNYLHQLNLQRLYVKFFDVIWDSGKQAAIPTAVVQVPEPSVSYIESLDIVPTVFITNQVFQNCDSGQLERLSNQIWAKIQERLPTKQFKEIQLDCDWTLGTKEAYFQFLRYSRKIIPKEINLSVTIRLHQYRYPEKTGIPPVDRGILMFYNMGNLKDWEETNSILNLEKAIPYLQNESYSLPLDLALPLFRWGVLYREDKMIKLINGLTNERLADTSFYERLYMNGLEEGTSRYQIKKSTYLDGYYLYEGDLLRLEWITAENLKNAALLLQSVVHTDTIWLSFYHLESSLLKAYDHHIFEECLEQISK